LICQSVVHAAAAVVRAPLPWSTRTKQHLMQHAGGDPADLAVLLTLKDAEVSSLRQQASQLADELRRNVAVGGRSVAAARSSARTHVCARAGISWACGTCLVARRNAPPQPHVQHDDAASTNVSTAITATTTSPP
jgi:hypothetical protein